ncbi:Nucleotide-diphospho-sugar transferases,Cytidylyltransferase IspD/TarI, partial [Cinara cedri]
MSPVYGGESRQDSVRLGLESLQTDYVMIHDACRPFISHTLIEKLIESMSCEHTGVVPVVDVEDTVSL